MPLSIDTSRTRVAGRFGALHTEIPVSLGWLTKYVTLPDAPASCQRPQFAGVDWGMLGNDRFGDCSFAGWVHLVMAIAALNGQSLSLPTAQAVVQAYLTFTHGVDSGAVLSQVLQAAHGAGLAGFGLAGFRAAGYAPGRGGVTELEQIISTFGAAYLGGAMTASDQQLFQAGRPWDLVGDNRVIGGHCFVGVEYDRASGMAKVLTWGEEQLVTYEWLEARLSEQWAVIPYSVKTVGHFQEVDYSQLEADLHVLPGAVG